MGRGVGRLSTYWRVAGLGKRMIKACLDMRCIDLVIYGSIVLAKAVVGWYDGEC